MKKPYIFQAVQKFLTENREPETREYCRSLHPEDLAALLPDLTTEEQLRLLEIIGHDAAADILSRSTADDQDRIAAMLPDSDLAAIITAMPSDDRVDLFKRLPEERGEKLLGLMARTEREDIRKLGSYKEGTAGSIMSSDYATLTPELTVQQALEKLRLEAPDKETIYSVYIIDSQRRLQGVVSLRNLITSRSGALVKDIMLTNPIFARADDDQEEVATKLNRYDLLAIPVINGNEALAGIVTFDDIHDVMIEETTEDFHRMGGLAHKASPDLANINMLDAGWWLLISKRLPWLLLLVFMNIFSGAGIAHFEGTIEAAVALVFFLPLLIDSGGNAGSQAATLMVRALATGKAQLKDWFALLRKEIFISATLGLVMGLAVSAIGIFRGGPEIAVVVALTMVCTVLFGSLVGMSLPFILSKLKMDPATASAPLITSIADIGGVLIYFSIATYVLRDMIALAG
ncbi:magnesium transporter [Desulfobulbus alkaliphilus]|uniref:magnesium transporter n=1 Tax=Desulfobulbus alkaliphilus TaxID=869814 RepID=UPI0019647D67|nr:magnesium transporter [Desulfobulbus alkaliphilus]MBM9537058.1 magnesium transporter [Desulfobulbus alkaliphilus]